MELEDCDFSTKNPARSGDSRKLTNTESKLKIAKTDQLVNWINIYQYIVGSIQYIAFFIFFSVYYIPYTKYYEGISRHRPHRI